MMPDLTPIAGAPGYFVDIVGGTIWSSRARRGQKAALHMLAGGTCRKGYRRHAFMINGKQKTFSAHVVVATAAFGHRPNNMQCCHINGNPSDNRAANLRWASCYENNGPDKAKHGKLAFGSAHRNAVLNERLVTAAKHRRASGEACSAIALDLGVSLSTIWRICTGKAWRHV